MICKFILRTFEYLKPRKKRKIKMKTCFTALLVEFVAMAQFVYPLHDIHPNAECARNLESWVKYQKLLEPNKRDGEPFRGL